MKRFASTSAAPAKLWTRRRFAGLKTLGRFARYSDGSTRLESWDADDPSVKVISINNVADRKVYVYSPVVGWVSYPMVLPPNGYTPPKYRREVKNVTLRSERFQGFEVYQVIGVAGDKWYRAPALNFFPLYEETAKDGQRKTFSNIQIREQNHVLFELPAGVTVTEKTEPRGVVWIRGGSSTKGSTAVTRSCSTCPQPR